MKYSIDKILSYDNQTGGNEEIIISGNNLIVIGDNGSGKTRLLNKLHEYLREYFNQHDEWSVDYFNNKLMELKKTISDISSNNMDIVHWKNQEEYYKTQLEKIKNFNVTSPTLSEFRVSYNQNDSILLFFPAHRMYQSQGSMSVVSRDSILKEYQDNKYNLKNGFSVSTYFERYIVSIWNYSLLQKSVGNDSKYKAIFDIIESIERDISELFEDDTLELSFNVDQLRIFINQANKSPFSLDQLSSGYSSILSIYTELIMRAEFEGVKKENINGVVIIDEIDAHLHVSLQKKVFDFFSKSFPNVQFIISTHSPFVLQSVSDAVIYNISTKEHLEDLSLFSYNSIVRGLLKESTVSSDADDLISELTELTKNRIINDRFNTIIISLKKNENALDNRAKLALALAENMKLDIDLMGN